MAETRASLAVRPTTTRWASVGRAQSEDRRAAGAAATTAALDGRTAELLVVFATPEWATEDTLAGIAEVAGQAPLIGTSVPAYLGPEGLGTSGVQVLALGGDGYRVRTAAAMGAAGPRAAGRALAQQLGCSPGADHDELVLLLSAALVGDQSEVVRGAYGVLGGAIPLVGGCTGSFPSTRSSCQLHGRQAHVDTLVGAAVRTDGRFAIAVEHGLARIGEPMVVSRSEAGMVYELDGRPALDVYLESLDPPDEAWHDESAFIAFALAHPLGLSRSSGPVQARCIGAASFEERALHCIADVPQGGLMWPAAATRESTLEAASIACEQAIAGLGGGPARALIVFDCVGRQQMLGEEGVAEELDLILGAADGATVAGFYTHGEIARSRGVNGFHNKAIVVLALG